MVRIYFYWEAIYFSVYIVRSAFFLFQQHFYHIFLGGTPLSPSSSNLFICLWKRTSLFCFINLEKTNFISHTIDSVTIVWHAGKSNRPTASKGQSLYVEHKIINLRNQCPPFKKNYDKNNKSHRLLQLLGRCYKWNQSAYNVTGLINISYSTTPVV